MTSPASNIITTQAPMNSSGMLQYPEIQSNQTNILISSSSVWRRIFCDG